MLAELHKFGELGVERNMRAAVGWYNASAEQGNVDAQLRLADMYYFGQGVAKNSAEAYRLYTSAAKLSSAEAQMQLGMFYQLEIRDPFASYMWVSISALNGYARAIEHKALIDKFPNDFSLSNAELNQAYDIAQSCIASGYRDCER